MAQWPLNYVPTSSASLREYKERIHAFFMAEKPTSLDLSDWYYDVIIPVARRGQKRDEYPEKSRHNPVIVRSDEGWQ